MPREFEPQRLLRRTLQVAALLGGLILIVLLAPGLGEVRDQAGGCRPGLDRRRDRTRVHVLCLLRGHVPADLL